MDVGRCSQEGLGSFSLHEKYLPPTLRPKPCLKEAAVGPGHPLVGQIGATSGFSSLASLRRWGVWAGSGAGDTQIFQLVSGGILGLFLTPWGFLAHPCLEQEGRAETASVHQRNRLDPSLLSLCTLGWWLLLLWRGVRSPIFHPHLPLAP